MRRIDEVKDITNTMNRIIDQINAKGIDLEPHQVNNMLLTNICTQLTQISMSLAVIADKLMDD